VDAAASTFICCSGAPCDVTAGRLAPVPDATSVLAVKILIEGQIDFARSQPLCSGLCLRRPHIAAVNASLFRNRGVEPSRELPEGLALKNWPPLAEPGLTVPCFNVNRTSRNKTHRALFGLNTPVPHRFSVTARKCECHSLIRLSKPAGAVEFHSARLDRVVTALAASGCPFRSWASAALIRSICTSPLHSIPPFSLPY